MSIYEALRGGLICYAYPNSTNARHLGYAKEGCFHVEDNDGVVEAFKTNEDAMLHILKTWDAAFLSSLMDDTETNDEETTI